MIFRSTVQIHHRVGKKSLSLTSSSMWKEFHQLLMKLIGVWWNSTTYGFFVYHRWRDHSSTELYKVKSSSMQVNFLSLIERLDFKKILWSSISINRQWKEITNRWWSFRGWAKLYETIIFSMTLMEEISWFTMKWNQDDDMAKSMDDTWTSTTTCHAMLAKLPRQQK